jgi:hypothetical protein
MGLFIWLRTEAFVEYVELFRLDSFFGVKKFRQQQLQGGDYKLDYANFLIINYNSFFVRLITCPFCLTVWASIIISNFIGWYYVPFLFTVTISLFGVISNCIWKE